MTDESITEPMQLLLQKMYVDLTDAAISANRIYKATQTPFTQVHRLGPKAREALGKKRASTEEILKDWIAEWKAEGRLSANGLYVKVSKAQAELLGIDETTLDIYDVCAHIGALFEAKN